APPAAARSIVLPYMGGGVGAAALLGAREMPKGSFVGCGQGLGLQLPKTWDRGIRVVSESKQYFRVNEENGNLYVNERLDREEMCGESATCSVSFEALVHNPLNVFHVEVAIEDVNDNTPRFLQDKFQLEINEFTSPGPALSATATLHVAGWRAGRRRCRS
uniref:Cadherin domain-containing protein n=1 Tax=Malurus cyaneus samueli TaxID=2593467 RepID=A0A8C5UDU5_9PASS